MMFKNVEFQLQAAHTKDRDWMNVFGVNTDLESVSRLFNEEKALHPDVSFRIIRVETITTVEELHIAGKESSAGLRTASEWFLSMAGMFDKEEEKNDPGTKD